MRVHEHLPRVMVVVGGRRTGGEGVTVGGRRGGRGAVVGDKVSLWHCRYTSSIQKHSVTIWEATFGSIQQQGSLLR